MVTAGLAIDRSNAQTSDPDTAGAFDLLAIPRPGRRAAILLAAVMFLVAAIATPFADLSLLPIPGYMTTFGSAMAIINVLLSALLFSKGAIEGRGNATRLGVAYLFVSIIFIPLIASFPGGIMEGSLIGTALSSVWLWSFWHAGFGVCIIRYAWFAAQPDERPASLRVEATVVVASVLVLTVTSTSLIDFLPSVLADGHSLFSGVSGLVPVIILLVLAVALISVCRLRARTPEELWLAVALVAAVFDVWLTYRGSQRFSLGWYLAKIGSLVTSLVVLITSLHEITQLYRRSAEANVVLASLARHDGLTGLWNRRHFDETISMECRRSQREEWPISLLMIDVDYFKKYNDQYGHPEGDACLREIAALLQSCARRPGDTAARYGGEEFVLILPNTDAAGAVAIAKLLQTKLRALARPHAGSPLDFVTLSIGVASAIAKSSAAAEDLVAEADRGLYLAKARNRNKICCADSILSPEDGLLAKFFQTSQISVVS